jgi:ribosomal protein S25
MNSSVYMSYETRACFNQFVLPNFKAVGKSIDRLVSYYSKETLENLNSGRPVLKRFFKRLPKNAVKNEQKWCPKFNSKKIRNLMTNISNARREVLIEVMDWERRQREMNEQKFEFTNILIDISEDKAIEQFLEGKELTQVFIEEEKNKQNRSNIITDSNMNPIKESDSDFQSFMRNLPTLMNISKENPALDTDQSLSVSIDSQESFYSGENIFLQCFIGRNSPLEESLPPCIKVLSYTSLITRGPKSGTLEEHVKNSNVDTADGQTSQQKQILLSGSFKEQERQDQDRRTSLQLQILRPLAERSFIEEFSNQSSSRVEYEEANDKVIEQNLHPNQVEPEIKQVKVTRSSNTTRINILRSLQKKSSRSPKNEEPQKPQGNFKLPSKGIISSKSKKTTETIQKEISRQNFFSSNLLENSTKLKLVISQKVKKDTKESKLI